MTNCKLVSTRVCKATTLHKKLCLTNKIEIKEIENSPYTQAVGILIMGVFSRYQSNLGKTHWQASKRITRYLKGIKGMNYALA